MWDVVHRMLCTISRYRVSWFLTCAIACASAANTTQLPEIRHVVFILVDDLGWADVGYHAQDADSYMVTPTIDAFAEEGVKLENYYVNQLCSPTRTSLLSGRYAYTLGTSIGITDGAPSHLPKTVSTIANRLQNAGWATAAFGKWDVGFTTWGYTPLCRGFDHFYGFYGAASEYWTHSTKAGGLDFRNDSEPVRNRDGVYFEEDITEEHLRWVTEMHRQDPYRRTFAYHAHQAVHAPLQVPKKYLKKGRCLEISEEHPSRRIMCGMMNMVDDMLGLIILRYQELKMWQHTILIFSSDNGGNSDQGGNNYPLRGNKGTTFEGGIRAVGWVGGGWPAIQRHYISRAMIHVSDWYPTIVQGIAGLEVNIEEDGYPGLDGISAWPALLGDVPTTRNEMLLNLLPFGRLPHNRGNTDMKVQGQGAIRVGRYKLLHGFTTVWQQISNSFGSGSCFARDGHTPRLLETTLPMTVETSPPFCPVGWVPPPESNLQPIPPPDGDGVYCQGNIPCLFFQSSLITGGTLLFDIEADPYEQFNLAFEKPDLVIELKKKLNAYNATNILQQHPPHDDESDPENWNGVRTPWKGDPNPEVCDTEDPSETHDSQQLFTSAMQMKTEVSEGEAIRYHRRKPGQTNAQTKQIELASDADKLASDADKVKNAEISLKASTTARDWAFGHDTVDMAWRLLSWWSLSVSGVGVSFVAGPMSFSTSWSQFSSVLPSLCSWS